MRRGKNSTQASLNKELDDLLGGNDDEIIDTKSSHQPKNVSTGRKAKTASSGNSKKALTSSSSAKDFYSNLSAIAGHDVTEDNDRDEDVEVTSEDAAQIAKGLADMDDLESDLFGSFTPKKGTPKPKVSLSKLKKKTTDFSDFDEDDPLAGLGLSDDDDILTKKPKTRHELTRKLSHTSSKGKVDPNLGQSASSLPDTSPARASSFEKEDPFLATDPRPRSGSGDRKLKRMNSWDDPSVGTQSASESDITPRSSTSSGLQLKHSRKGSNRKKINPVFADKGLSKNQAAHLHDGDSFDHPETTVNDGNISADNGASEKRRSNKKNQQSDDMFADDDDLPGLSEDEGSLPKKVSKKIEDEEPVRKATLALDDLLTGKSKVSERRAKKPTFLDQMMAKNDNKGQGLSTEGESPLTSPRDKDVRFGGYSPSLGGTKDRPVTAPNKRSVRFADELGFDELDMSFSDSRPTSAPESGRSRKVRRKSRESSFEDENTDVSLDLSAPDFRKKSFSRTVGLEVTSRKVSKPGAETGIEKGSDWRSSRKNENRVDSSKKNDLSPRSQRLQTSRRKQSSFGETQQPSNDDWLGFGDGEDLSNVANKIEQTKTGNESEIDKTKDKKKEITEQSSQDDWLGLSDNVTEDAKEKAVVESTANENNLADGLKVAAKDAVSVNKQRINQTNVSVDELFPWETPDGSARQRRGQKFRNSNNLSSRQNGDIFADSISQTEDQGTRIKAPISHSTPVAQDAKKKDILADAQPASAQIPAHLTQQQQQTQQNLTQTIQHSRSTAPGMLQPSQYDSTQIQKQQYANSQALIEQMQQSQNMAFQQEALRHSLAGSSFGQATANPLVLQDALLAQMMAAKGLFLPQGNQPNVSNATDTPAKTPDVSLAAVELEKWKTAEKAHQHKIDEYEAEKTQQDKDRQILESELRELQTKMSSFEEGKVKTTVELTMKIEELENKIRKLELEKEHLTNSQEMFKKRHDEEIKAMESSYKTRYRILEETYQRREAQLKEEQEFAVKQLHERMRGFEIEKAEIAAANKGRIEMFERSKNSDIERIKDIHKKAMEDMRNDYEVQLERIRVLKEQEVTAATSMFSQTKSLQSLIQQVHKSSNEVEQLQKRIDFTHKDNLSEKESSLRIRDEHLKSMQERLHRQETENTEERARLQSLVAKLEMQLREQSRQLEQDRWKITQDDNRIKALQVAVDDERRYTMQQLNNERQMVEKSRDELMNEQRRILAECHEEQRKVNSEKQKLESSQSQYNKESLEREFRSLKQREMKIVADEERLERERKSFEQSYTNMNEKKLKLENFALQIQTKSEEVEKLSKEATRLQQEGLDALEKSHLLKEEASNSLENRAFSLDQQEQLLSEESASLEMAKKQFEMEKGSVRCIQCQRFVSKHVESSTKPSKEAGTLQAEEQIPFQYQQQQQRSLSSPSLSIISSNSTAASSAFEKETANRKRDHGVGLQKPDVVLESLNFNRTLRKWTRNREQDEEFFEEENRFLDEIQRKRETKRTKK